MMEGMRGRVGLSGRGTEWEGNLTTNKITYLRRGFARKEKGVCFGELTSLGKLEGFYGLL